MTCFDQFPGLSQINHHLATGEANFNLSAEAATFCQALLFALANSSTTNLIKQMDQAVDQWLQRTGDASQGLDEVSQLWTSYQTNLDQVFSFLAEQAVMNQEGIALARTLQKIAQHSSAPIFHFLSAWIFLNLNEREACIRQCHQVKIPYSPIQSLLGQAYMEQGKLPQASKALQNAVRMDPQDLLSWFMLAKVYLAQDQLDQAWEATQKCHALAPGHPEVHALIGLIAIDERHQMTSWLKSAWHQLYPHWLGQPDQGLLTVMLYQLAFRLDDRHKARSLTDQAHWPALRESSDFMQQLSWLLRSFQQKNWWAENRDFLQEISPAEGEPPT
jgi:tetratricopeptide (TPR) repeat protein